MASRFLDHIDLRVSSLAANRGLFDAFFPALGFSQVRSGEGWISYSVPGDPKSQPFIQVDEMPGHRGNANRFAFWADTESGSYGVSLRIAAFPEKTKPRRNARFAAAREIPLGEPRSVRRCPGSSDMQGREEFCR